MFFKKKMYRYVYGIKSVLVNGNLKISKMARENALIEICLVAAVKGYDFLTGGRVRKEIELAMDTFIPEEMNRKRLSKVKRDMWKSRELYLVNSNEYFLFGFESLSPEERHQFVGNREKELLCGKINRNGAWKIFMDKWETYQRFKPFYGREVIKLESESDKAYFEEFCLKHKRVIVKANNSSQGRGIFIADVDTKEKIDTVFEKILKIFKERSTVVVEQCIKQNDKMGKFHPGSVNTVRIATFIKDDGVDILFSFFRMGRNNSEVDNAGAGGILAAVDILEGVVITDGFSENGEVYKTHPNTMFLIKGYSIPEWECAIELVKKLAMVVPEQVYVGWDLAYTDTGWIMIEGNSWGQYIVQIPLRKGIRSIIEDSFYKLI